MPGTGGFFTLHSVNSRVSRRCATRVSSLPVDGPALILATRAVQARVLGLGASGVLSCCAGPRVRNEHLHGRLGVSQAAHTATVMGSIPMKAKLNFD